MGTYLPARSTLLLSHEVQYPLRYRKSIGFLRNYAREFRSLRSARHEELNSKTPDVTCPSQDYRFGVPAPGFSSGGFHASRESVAKLMRIAANAFSGTRLSATITSFLPSASRLPDLARTVYYGRSQMLKSSEEEKRFMLTGIRTSAKRALRTPAVLKHFRSVWRGYKRWRFLGKWPWRQRSASDI